MEKVIYLETDEEITSVIDRVKKAQSKELALIAPRGAIAVQGIVNLKLLRREADKIGKKVYLVTTDKAAKNLASQVGITAFEKLDEAIDIMPESEEESYSETEKSNKISPEEKFSAREIKYKKIPAEKKFPIAQNFSQQKSRRPKPYWKYALGTFVFLILAGAFAAYVLLPKATVALTLNSEAVDSQFRINVDKSLKAYDSEENTIPGQIVTTTKEITQKAEATGKKDIGKPASGSITVYNSWSSAPQSFPAGTKFRSSSGKIYIATSAFTIPALKYEGKVYPGSTKISAIAIENGDQYNGSLGKIMITSVSSAQQSSIYGQGSTFSGGFTKKITVVTKEDIETVKKKVSSEINDALSSEITTKVSENSTYVKESVVKEVIKDETNPALDKEAKEFEVKMQVKISAIAYKKSDFDQVVEKNLQKNLEGKTIIPDAPKEVSANFVKQDMKKGVLTLDINIKAQVGPELDRRALFDNLSGKNNDAAISYLKGFPQVKDAQINLWPFWVKKIPALEDSIKLDIKYVASQPQSQDQDKAKKVE